MTLITVICLVAAGVPAALFLVNLFAYRSLPRHLPDSAQISVLIPARNEEATIVETMETVLANRGCEFELVVLNDHSTDQTATKVAEVGALDRRVRLEEAPTLPKGWCGKQHACHVLAKLARYPLLVFLDADVRLAPDALLRLAAFMNSPQPNEIALASGVPRQEFGSFAERLLIPLIHFILLGFLPVYAMRRTLWPAFSAGCGQLFVIRRDAYEQCEGHARLPASLHDGIKLPRVFRQAGFATDLFDATDIARCRMYRTSAETWSGLSKNAIEGLAAPSRILPMTLLLVAGQILPFWLVLCGSRWAVLGIVFAWLPRVLACWRFKQPVLSALLQPVGIAGLLGIQWYAFARHELGRPAQWRGRVYPSSSTVHSAKSA